MISEQRLAEVESLIPEWYEDWYTDLYPGDKILCLMAGGCGATFETDEAAKYAEAAKYIPELIAEIRNLQETAERVRQVERDMRLVKWRMWPYKLRRALGDK